PIGVCGDYVGGREGAGWGEGERGRVEERPGDGERRPRTAVTRVAHDGVPDGLEVHADLVGAPGLERALEERHLRLAVLRADRVGGAGAAPPFAHAHARRTANGTADRGVDDTAWRVEAAPH